MFALSRKPAELLKAPQYAKVLNLVRKLKVFDRPFFKRVAGCGAEPHNTECAPKKVNCEIVRWTISQ